MKYKYKAWLGKIEKVEIIKETEKMVEINGVFGQRKEVKLSGSHSYHDTFDAAKKILVKETEKKIEALELRLSLRLKELERVKSLTEIDVKEQGNELHK